MRKFLILILILFVFIAAIPLADGYLYKSEFDSMIRSSKQESNSNISSEYHLGWLRSHAKFIVSSKNNPASVNITFANPQMEVDQDIIHGPIIYDSKHQKFVIAEALINSQVNILPYEKLLDVGSFIKMQTLVDFNHNYSTSFSSPAFVKEVPGRIKFSWGGFNGKADVMSANDMHFQSANVVFDVAPFEVDSPIGPYSFKTSGINSRINMTASSFPGLYNGKHYVTIDSMTYSALDKEIFLLDNFNWQSNTKVTNNLFGFNVNIHLARLDLPGQIEIKPAIFNLTCNDLNSENFIKISKMNHEERQINLNTIYTALLTPTSNIKGDLAITTSQGNLSASLDINWKNQAMPIKVEDIQAKTNLQLNLRISSQLLNYLVDFIDERKPQVTQVDGNAAPPITFRKQITDFINRGYLIQDKNDYTSLIVLEQGKVKINGKLYVPTQETPVATPVPAGGEKTAAKSFTTNPLNKVPAVTFGKPFVIKHDALSQS